MSSVLNKKNSILNSAIDVKVCENCSASEDSASTPNLSACSRCGLVVYCSKDCQRAHWRANHKQHCVGKADQRPQKPNSSSSFKEPTNDLPIATVKCAICQDILSDASNCTLPCSHTFHGTCIADLRKFGVKQVCPLCRIPLHLEPEIIFNEAIQRYISGQRLVDGGAASWASLPASMQQ